MPEDASIARGSAPGSISLEPSAYEAPSVALQRVRHALSCLIACCRAVGSGPWCRNEHRLTMLAPAACEPSKGSLRPELLPGSAVGAKPLQGTRFFPCGSEPAIASPGSRACRKLSVRISVAALRCDHHKHAIQLSQRFWQRSRRDAGLQSESRPNPKCRCDMKFGLRISDSECDCVCVCRGYISLYTPWNVN